MSVKLGQGKKGEKTVKRTIIGETDNELFDEIKIAPGDLSPSQTWVRSFGHVANAGAIPCDARRLIENLEKVGDTPVLLIVCSTQVGNVGQGFGPHLLGEVQQILEYRCETYLKSEATRAEAAAEEQRRKEVEERRERRARLIRNLSAKIRGARVAQRAALLETATSNLESSYEAEAEKRLIEEGEIEPEVEALETVG